MAADLNDRTIESGCFPMRICHAPSDSREFIEVLIIQIVAHIMQCICSEVSIVAHIMQLACSGLKWPLHFLSGLSQLHLLKAKIFFKHIRIKLFAAKSISDFNSQETSEQMPTETYGLL